MPAIVNKILINDERTKATRKAIKGEYKNLKRLGKESMPWIGETQPLAEKMKKACDKHDAADLEYLGDLREIVEDLRQLNDSKLVPKP